MPELIVLLIDAVTSVINLLFQTSTQSSGFSLILVDLLKLGSRETSILMLVPLSPESS